LERAILVIIRAGSPDWYGRSIRNRKIAGSNPAQSTKWPAIKCSLIFKRHFQNS
jgi:hypothetical protein